MKSPYLVVIDVQEKLFPVIHKKEIFLKNLEILVKGFQLFELPIILTEQVPDKLGPTIEPIRSLLEDVDPIINPLSHVPLTLVSYPKRVLFKVMMG